ncbi:uncharacterized protein MYCFIDRAFT_176848 [Pseudocercospora fijiensis CIRAD86]|uniref:Uncharacterized protein n=1 Tax=Pseudocercospora fijiensis (strain CIRAD86) TaxID=383855 RepID=M3AQZ7_PSEFD|nr:uncharacterized protein MYCFIDRAFT_176848 [Pseudocercospora fijiensis CIRAD86]EME79847.1 hypothetical protein MYCFIDRAFT_176848 [Pseudocercospora fijiensis CIRAD86]
MNLLNRAAIVDPQMQLENRQSQPAIKIWIASGQTGWHRVQVLLDFADFPRVSIIPGNPGQDTAFGSPSFESIPGSRRTDAIISQHARSPILLLDSMKQPTAKDIQTPYPCRSALNAAYSCSSLTVRTWVGFWSRAHTKPNRLPDLLFVLIPPQLQGSLALLFIRFLLDFMCSCWGMSLVLLLVYLGLLTDDFSILNRRRAGAQKREVIFFPGHQNGHRRMGQVREPVIWADCFLSDASCQCDLERAGPEATMHDGVMNTMFPHEFIHHTAWPPYPKKSSIEVIGLVRPVSLEESLDVGGEWRGGVEGGGDDISMSRAEVKWQTSRPGAGLNNTYRAEDRLRLKRRPQIEVVAEFVLADRAHNSRFRLHMIAAVHEHDPVDCVDDQVDAEMNLLSAEGHWKLAGRNDHRRNAFSGRKGLIDSFSGKVQEQDDISVSGPPKPHQEQAYQPWLHLIKRVSRTHPKSRSGPEKPLYVFRHDSSTGKLDIAGRTSSLPIVFRFLVLWNWDMASALSMARSLQESPHQDVKMAAARSYIPFIKAESLDVVHARVCASCMHSTSFCVSSLCEDPHTYANARGNMTTIIAILLQGAREYIVCSAFLQLKLPFQHKLLFQHRIAGINPLWSENWFPVGNCLSRSAKCPISICWTKSLMHGSRVGHLRSGRGAIDDGLKASENHPQTVVMFAGIDARAPASVVLSI